MADTQHRIFSRTYRPITSGEELYDLSTKYVAVWGVAFGMAWIVDYALSAVVPLAYGWRMGLSGLALYLTALTIFVGGRRRTDLLDSLMAWRHVITVLLAGMIGYAWHAHDYSNSNDALLNEASRWACAQHSPCIQSVERYLFDRKMN
jgi:hypothetical protein